MNSVVLIFLLMKIKTNLKSLKFLLPQVNLEVYSPRGAMKCEQDGRDFNYYKNQCCIKIKNNPLFEVANSWLDLVGLEMKYLGNRCLGVVKNYHPPIDKLKLNKRQRSCGGFKEGSHGCHKGNIMGHLLH